MDDYNPSLGGAPQTPQDANSTRYFPPQGSAPAGAQPPSQPATPATPATPSSTHNQATSSGVPPHQPSNANAQAGPFHPPPQPRNSERDRTLLGLILVAGGVLFLLGQLDVFGSMGNLILLAIGSVFMYAYFTTSQGHRIGFLIPGAILLGIGTGVAINNLPLPWLWPAGDATVFTLGLGFCLIWALERKHWWALIPGGILVTVGLSSLFAIMQLWPLVLIGLGAYLLYEQSRRHSRP